MSDLQYPAYIRPLSTEEGGGYLVEFPDLPGCMADGETVEEALHNAEDAMHSWLLTAKKFEDEIPEPSLPCKFSGQWRMRVPKSLHAALVLRAREEGVSLNTLAATMLAQCLGKANVENHKHSAGF